MFWEPQAEEKAAWSRVKRGADVGLANNLLGVGYDWFKNAQNQESDTTKLNRQYDQMRERLPGGYAKRGLLNSGLYHQGLTDYGTQRGQATSDMTQKYQQAFGDLAVRGTQGLVTWGQQQADAAEAEALRRAEIATQLKALQ